MYALAWHTFSQGNTLRDSYFIKADSYFVIYISITIRFTNRIMGTKKDKKRVFDLFLISGNVGNVKVLATTN